MVVGTGSYKDIREAYPLDKKTLNKVVLRSFFAGASWNAETGSSIGWTWALKPALEKIHTDKDDLALSLGHNLELSASDQSMSTLAMGIVLALEQQKADLETIRSARTVATGATDAVSKLFLSNVLIALALLLTNVLPIAAGLLVGAVAVAAVQIALRFVMMYYGYSKGVRAAENLVRHQDALTRAARLSGIAMLGGMTVYLAMNGNAESGALISLNSVIPGVVPLLLVWMCYHGLTRKNWSLGKCMICVILIGFVLGALMIH